MKESGPPVGEGHDSPSNPDDDKDSPTGKKEKVIYYVNVRNHEFLRKAGYNPSHFADFINEKAVRVIREGIESDEPLPTEMEIKRRMADKSETSP